MMDNYSTVMENLNSELRRGTLVLSVLSQLKSPQYGYSLIQCLSEQGLEIEQNTLYPLLRRLEKQELVDSSWSVEEARPRRYYILSALGIKVLAALTVEWQRMNATLTKMLEEVEINEKETQR